MNTSIVPLTGLVCAALLALTSPTLADEHAEPQAAERSPGDMTVEERVQMMEGANEYNTCVYNAALERIDTDPDIRRIADGAMGHCQPRLEALAGTIEDWGFAPYFAEGFTRNVRDRAARKLLPELAVRKSR